MGQAPSVKEAQVVADEIFSDFVSQEVDKVEMIYTKFVSLISSDPVVQTLLPLTPQVCTHIGPNSCTCSSCSPRPNGASWNADCIFSYKPCVSH